MNEDFIAIVRSRLPLLSEGQQLAPDTALADLGLDSLQTVSLLLDLEDAFEISLPDAAIGDPETFRTPGRLWEIVDSAQPEMRP